MGGFLSKYYFRETNKECLGRIDTPKAAPRHKIIIDPRSPSAEISRTPIQVEAVSGHRGGSKKKSPLAAAPVQGGDVGRGVCDSPVSTSVKHRSVGALQLQGQRDPVSTSYGIARTPQQMERVGTGVEQPMEQVQEILLYEGQAEVPLVRNSPREAAHPSCARIMGLPPQEVTVRQCPDPLYERTRVGPTEEESQLNADMSTFLTGLSKALSLTETQQLKVMRTYHGRESSAHPKRLQDDARPTWVRVPLSSVNSPHQMWRGPGGKDDRRRRVADASENTPPPGILQVTAVWDQDATVVI